MSEKMQRERAAGSREGPGSGESTGFRAADFDLLRDLGDGVRSGEGDAPPPAAVDELWARARRSIEALGAGLFEAGHEAALWPEGEGDDGDRGPFLWARTKRRGNDRFATHIGVFLSPGGCNLAIDLEKDLLDAGRADESLQQVLGFCRDRLPSLAAAAGRDDLSVWTDSRNVVAATAFGEVDFDAFMAANRDAGHPWPKIGYLMEAAEVSAFGDRWAREYLVRATPLVVIYDAMIASYAE